jgi:hypothetical protein
MINKLRQSALFLISILVMACAGSPAPAPVPAASKPADELDAAIRETSDYLNKQLPKGNKLVVLNIQSEYPALSEYIIDELIANTVNDRVFTVVDRQQLDTLRQELDFQTTGEVDDETAQALGRIAGAQIIVSGAVSRIGDLYRLRVRALSVQTAQIAGQFNRNIPDGPTVVALAQSRATGYGESSGRPVAVSSTKPDAAQAEQVVAPASVPEAPTPAATVTLVQAAPAPTYSIGDTGPAGGIIFYDKKVFTNGWRYLEAMPAEMEFTAQWGTPKVETETAVGSGKRNSQRIVEALKQLGQNDRAAELCVSLEFGGYKDWFLPSADELDLMYKNLKKKELGGFGNSWYWSSSDDYSSYAFSQRFSDGRQEGTYSSAKTNTYSVRAARQF